MSVSGIRAGRAYVELAVVANKLNKGLNDAQNKIASFAADAKANLVSAFAVAAPIALATKTFAAFDDQMRLAQGVTGSTGAQFAALTEQAKELGRTTSWTAAEVAQGMTSLGRAGFNADEINAAIEGVMNMARATGTEIGPATDIASNALRSFRLEASEMTRVVDVLTATANGSAQTLEDLGEAFKYVAPLAVETGLTIEDTAKIVGALANFGVKGSQAGTVLKAIQTRMASDAKAQKTYLELGIDVRDAEGNLRKVNDVLIELGERLQNVPSAEKLATIKTLFGQYGLTGVAITTANFRELNDAIDAADGTAARVAETMDAGLGGAYRIMESAVEGLAIAVGESLVPTLTKAATQIENAAGWLTRFTSSHPGAISAVASLTTKMFVLQGGIFVVCKAFDIIINRTKTAVNFFHTLYRGLSFLTGATRLQAAAETARAATAQALANVEKNVAAVNAARTASERAAAQATLALSVAEYKSAASAQANAIAKAKARAATIAMTAASLAAVAVVAALGYALVRYSSSADRAADSARKAGDAARQIADENAQRRVMDDELFRQLDDLASKQNLTNEEFAKAQNIVAELTDRYGDLGLSADETARKIYGMAGAQSAFNEAKRKQERQEIKDQLETNLAEIDRVKEAQRRLNENFATGAVGGVRQFFGGKSLMERNQEYIDRCSDLIRQNRTLQMRMDALENESAAAAKDEREAVAMPVGPQTPWVVSTGPPVDHTVRIEQALKPLEAFEKLAPEFAEPTKPKEGYSHILPSPLPGQESVLALDLSGFDSIRAQLAQEFDGLAVEAAQFSVESVGTFSAYETLGDFNARQLDESRRQTRILEDVRDVLRRSRDDDEWDDDLI